MPACVTGSIFRAIEAMIAKSAKKVTRLRIGHAYHRVRLAVMTRCACRHAVTVALAGTLSRHQRTILMNKINLKHMQRTILMCYVLGEASGETVPLLLKKRFPGMYPSSSSHYRFGRVVRIIPIEVPAETLLAPKLWRHGD